MRVMFHMKQFPLLRYSIHSCLCILSMLHSPFSGAENAPASYPQSLPPAPLVRIAIAAAPMTELARLGWLAEQSQAGLLRSGSYEWTARVAVQRRRERLGSSFTEPELSLERPVRWGNKAAIDGRLAEAGLAAALSGFEDAWHESGRTLLKAWFDVAREESTVTSWVQQTELSRQQVSVVERRVAAGDAPRLETLLAQGEHERSVAALASARLHAQAQRVEFDRKYPALQGLRPATLGAASDIASDTPPATENTANSVAQMTQAILADNHEIELAQANTLIARLRLERTDSERRADPTVGIRYAQERGGQDNIIGVHIAIPFGSVARDTRARLAAVEADKAATREQETTVRVGYEAAQAAQAVPLTRQIAHQLTASAQKANTAATLAGKAYAEGETLLANWLQARRQASETQLAATLAQVNAEEAAARAQLDAHQLWTPPPLDSSSHDFSVPHGEVKP